MQSVVKILQRLDKDKITFKGFNNIGMASEKLYQNTLNRSLNKGIQFWQMICFSCNWVFACCK